jgi:hypothetical protein
MSKRKRPEPPDPDKVWLDMEPMNTPHWLDKGSRPEPAKAGDGPVVTTLADLYAEELPEGAEPE